MSEKIRKSDAEWRSQLTDDQFRVSRQRGTEPPFTGKYNAEKRPGTYTCVCCGQELFSSDMKFDSGTGWPSFTEPTEQSHVEMHEDRSYGMVRVEATCSRCGAHLGHVFEDGPGENGLRYCINSASLRFIPLDELESAGYGSYR